MQLRSLAQAIILQTKGNIFTMDTNGEGYAAGEVFFIIHDVTAANCRKTMLSGNSGIDDRSSGDRVKRELIGIGNNI